MGPVTLVLRTESLNYRSDVPFSWHHEEGYMRWDGRRHTAGSRVRLPGGFMAQVDLVRQAAELAEYGRSGVDVALTYSIRRD
jgi:hypothetical protein